MVKDLKYFLEQEEEFCRKHPQYGQSFYDESIKEFSFYGINDPLNFLSEKIISKTHDKLGKPLGREDELGLSSIQRVLLRLLYCQHSYLFRDDYYNDINECVQNLLDTLDNMVSKAPKTTSSILYRLCNTYDRIDFKKGDIVTIPYNLTCTNFDWHQEKYNNVYIIFPLTNGNTKAQNLFEIYKHGDENQIDFLRGTHFEVTKIEQTEATSFLKIYLKEIESLLSTKSCGRLL